MPTWRASRTRVTTHEWSSLSSHSLVSIMHTSLQVRQTLAQFLPEPYRREVSADEHLLLCMLGLLAEEQREVIAHHILLFIIMVPYVQAELVRRAHTHVGFPAALLVLLHQLEASADVAWQPSAAGDAMATVALHRLMKSTVRSSISRAAGRAPEQELRDNLPGEIWQTVIRRFGQRDALDVLARAFDGQLNIAPRAIVDDVIEHLTEVLPTVPLPEDNAGPAVLPTQDEALLARFLQAYPQHADGVACLCSPKPLAELASAHGVTVQTIMNWKRRAERQLRAWL